MGSNEDQNDDLKAESMDKDKPRPNENTQKLKSLMRQLSEQSPIMNGSTRDSLAKRYTKILTVVAIYW